MIRIIQQKKTEQKITHVEMEIFSFSWEVLIPMVYLCNWEESIKHYSLVNIAALPFTYDTSGIYAINVFVVFDRLVVVLVRGLLLIAV